MVATQSSLIPEVMPEWDDRLVPLNDLPAPNDPIFAGRRPTKEMTTSISLVGVQQPVMLDFDGQSYSVIDGRHRIVNARAAGMVAIPARVRRRTNEFDLTDGLSLIANHHRSDNWYSDLVAIERLVERGFTVSDISETLSIDKQRLDKILKLQKLVPEMREAMAQGRMKKSAAYEMVKLSPEKQRQLAGRSAFSIEDAKNARLIEKSGYMQTLDLGTLELSPLGDSQEEVSLTPSWVETKPPAIDSEIRNIVLKLRDDLVIIITNDGNRGDAVARMMSTHAWLMSQDMSGRNQDTYDLCLTNMKSSIENLEKNGWGYFNQHGYAAIASGLAACTLILARDE